MATTPPRFDDVSPPRRRWAIVIVVGLVLALGLLWFVGSMSTKLTATGTITFTGPATTATPVVLPSDPMTIALRQRSGMQLPGGAGTPTLSLGDITGGQVIVTVAQASGPTIFSQSMKAGDAASFAHAGQTVHLKLATLQNRLVGDDQATIQLSAAQPISEAEKIDALIAHLESLEGAVFIRNGESHAPKDAAAHLRRKRDSVGDKLTADQFIDELASKSSISGDPYSIKLKDGIEVPAGDYLRKKLPEIESELRGNPKLETRNSNK